MQSPKTKYDVWILPMEGNQRAPMPFQATEFDENMAEFSPNARWIAYESDESGRFEVYVREFSPRSDGKPQATEKHQISNDGGREPHWRADGKELFYLSLDRRTLRSADIIASKASLQFLETKLAAPLPAMPISPLAAVDGKRFLAMVPVAQSGPQQFTVILNWQAGLKK